jgi:hypothetical protein
MIFTNLFLENISSLSRLLGELLVKLIWKQLTAEAR